MSDIVRSLKILVRELLHTTIRPIRKLKNDQGGQNFKRKRQKRVLKSAWSENRQLRGYKQLFLSKIAARRAAKILGAQKFQKGPPGFQKGTRVILRKRRGPRFRGQGSLGEATFSLGLRADKHGRTMFMGNLYPQGLRTHDDRDFMA